MALAQENKYVETPLMKQYYNIKHTHPDAILLFRVGDFYETFGEDAIRSSSILGITLTRRANGSASFVELAGFPYHALDTYLPKLVQAGERVAICEQLEDPKTAKKIVKRGVIELITPGVSFNDNIIPRKENSFVASVYFGKKNMGIAFLDVTTGEFLTAEGDQNYMDKLLTNLKPKEVLFQRGCKDQFLHFFGDRYYLYPLEQWIFSESGAREKLKTQFGVTSLRGYGVESMSDGLIAAGAILYYLEFTEHRQTSHINSISRIEEDKYVWLDRYSLANLEIFQNNSGKGPCFVDIIDKTVTPMGARLLKRWISLPLKDKKQIELRQKVVGYFLEDAECAVNIYKSLSQLNDLERLVSKIVLGRVSPREILQLKRALTAIQDIKQYSINSCCDILKKWVTKLDGCNAICDLIDRTIMDDPAISIQKGAVIKTGISAELDELRRLSLDSKAYLERLQQQESERTGIPSLKISYNNVFGYYIEVRNTHKDKVPEEWVRKQTLANAERYITAELKEYEEKILGAEEKILSLEAQIYNSLINELASHAAVIQTNAAIAAQIDVILSFASAADEYHYVCPSISEDIVLDIKEGRHPVIENLMASGDRYIPNDLYLDHEKQQIIIVTGPNMSGKSALLRQTALIVLMAQIGSYVPASSAVIGLVDKIFTRVGASDNISQGESTFMVEMLESANILNNITDKSLVLLDEIGRGTSTYDGISIAWSMVEYLHQSHAGSPRTLFATHYHELNQLAEQYPRIKNFNVQVKEINNRVIFLRKLVAGGTEHSFGIHVARMAGMPRSVVSRAEEILQLLESRARERNKAVGSDGKELNMFKEFKGTVTDQEQGVQLSLFQLDDPLLYQIRDRIKSLDINRLTPVEALNILNDIKNLLGVK